MRADLRVGDARALEDVRTEMLVINPPRGGIGADLRVAITTASPEWVVYSSCNATSLARDLAGLPGHRVVRAGLFDMLPQTRHHEVIALLERR